jgi:hypothetical protein
MKIEIEVRKTKTIEIDKETLKEACKQMVLNTFEEEFERAYVNITDYWKNDIEIYIDTQDVITELIDEQCEDDDWDYITD